MELTTSTELPFGLDGPDALEPWDVFVVGGGVAGCYSAWRLQTGAVAPGSALPADPSQRRIALAEKSFRIGGRLESLAAPGTNGIRAEFGGMGYSADNDARARRLADYMGLPVVDFPMPDANDFVYVRGVRLRHDELTDPAKIPYRLAPDEVGKGPGALIVQAIEKVIPGSSSWTTEQWWEAATTYRVRGQLLNDLGYWNLLLMGMSNEAFAFCTETMGHFFEFDNWNAAQAIPWILTQSVGPYKTVSTGYDQLPKSAANAFVEAGGEAGIASEVTGISWNGSTFSVDLFISGSIRGTVQAKRVLLALPQRALEMLAPQTAVLQSSEVQALMSGVTGRKVMKIFLTFDRPWWNDLNITQGASSTDLPMSQCWYFDPIDGQGDALLMASYNDTLKTTFWQGLEGGDRFLNAAVGAPPAGFWRDQTPSQLMVDELMRQVREMHDLDGGVAIPDPLFAAYKDWTHDPFGGAYSTWDVGVDVPLIAATMLQPDPSLPLHVIGSTYSRDQGWAEGAFATADIVLTDMIGLDPDWP